MTKDGVRNLRLESIYHSLETSFGAVRNKIIGDEQPTSSDLDAIVNFMAAQIIRTPKFRNAWKFSVSEEDHAGKLMSISDTAVRLQVENQSRTIWENRNQILCLVAYPTVLGYLHEMRVRLYKSAEPRAFVTSDAPCSVIDYKDLHRTMLEALASSTVNIVMSLSPTVVAILDRSDKPHEMTQIFPGHASVNTLNSMMWYGAEMEVVLPNSTVPTEWSTEEHVERLSRYVAL